MNTAAESSAEQKFETTRLPFGVQVSGINLKDASLETCSELRSLVYQNKLLVISNQNVAPSDYVAFARKIGKPQVYLQKNYHHPDFPEIFVSANGPVSGRSMGVARTGYFWHSDCSFEPKPLAFTMIYPQVLPTGERSTYFIDMNEALERLPKDLKLRIHQFAALHDGHSRYKITESDVGRPLHEILDFLAGNCPYAIHPVVCQHPVTGQNILYVNSGFTSRILGFPFMRAGIFSPKYSPSRKTRSVHIATNGKKAI